MLKARVQDYHFTNILQQQLQDYLAKPIPRKTLEEITYQFIAEIRKKSRVKVELNESLYWDKRDKQVVYNNEQIRLTKKEREFLSLLFSNINREFTYEYITHELWNDSYVDKKVNLRTLIKQLRRKLPVDFIKNIFGIGYTIDIKQEKKS
jgi:DNA-binding response OmpR family regulator